VHQLKYTNDLMKKFNMAELKPVSTLMSSAVSLGPNEDGNNVNIVHPILCMIIQLVNCARMCACAKIH
jgi:hypothetical protein